MGLNATGKVITAFFMLILGIGLLGTVSSSTDTVTSTDTAIMELVDINAAKGNDTAGIGDSIINGTVLQLASASGASSLCPITGFALFNYSNGTSDWVLDTDYTFDVNRGQLSFINTTITYGLDNSSPNITFVNYTTCPDGYINQAWGRTVLNSVSGFFAIALMLIAVGLFYSVGKDSGLI